MFDYYVFKYNLTNSMKDRLLILVHLYDLMNLKREELLASYNEYISNGVKVWYLSLTRLLMLKNQNF